MRTQNPAEEVWKPIEEFPDYAVSSHGRVYSFKNDLILTPRLDSAGYYKLSIYRDAKRYTRLVSRLVAITFLGPPPSDKHEADHINAVRTDNRPENLRWLSKKENLRRRDMSEIARGESQGLAKLTEEQVKQIRRRYAIGPKVTQTELAKEYGVDQSIISDIVNRKTWKHI